MPAYAMCGWYRPNDKDHSQYRKSIDETLEWLDALPAARLAGAETREITLELRRGPVRFDGQRYLAHFALPNFFFHLTTAYDILRHCGVAVGKADFLGDFKGLAR